MIENIQANTITLSKDQYAVYSCLCYFNIFNHPLTADEISDYCHSKTELTKVQIILSELLAQKIVYTNKGFYSLYYDNEDQIARRIYSEKYFHKKRKIIQRFARFIALFPYVEAVALSGSCSKGLLDSAGDVDFFIIAKPNKLWLCRTILVLFKKIFLLNSKKYFCLNYFVDVNSLEIPDKNIFVACEIKTLTPINNKALFEAFLEANSWTNEYLPNKNYYNQSFLDIKKSKKHIFTLFEKALDSKLGEKLDDFCFRLTVNVWKRKFSYMATPDLELNFRSKKDVSKHHPRAFQGRVLNELKKQLEHIEII